MGVSVREEPAILQLRAVLRGISPLIWRRLLVRSDSTVAHLHEVLQTAFGWEDAHLHRFQIRGREYGVARAGGLSFDTDARKVRLCDLQLRRLERFVYEYDFGDAWIHDLRLEATLAVDPRKGYPACVGGKGAAPPEDCGGPYAFMENRWQYALLGSRGKNLMGWSMRSTTRNGRCLDDTTRTVLIDARSIGHSPGWPRGHTEGAAYEIHRPDAG